MIACTFQPNVPRQSLAAGPAAARAAGTTTTTGAYPRSSGDGGDNNSDSDSDGDGEGGERISCDSARGAGGAGRLSGSANNNSKGGAFRSSSRKGLDGTAVATAQRLYEETGRLDERRFEGQERKRMWEEEVYARTCTFEVSIVYGID